MNQVEPSADVLDRYSTALQVLGSTHQHLENQNLRGYVFDPGKRPRDQLESIVATLCEQARAAEKLATAADALCAALVADRRRAKRRPTCNP